MNVDWVRELCSSFPHATEQVTWGADLTFRVNGKIFAVTVLEPAPVWLSFKCSPENFAELTERAGIIPAPYLARAQWVALETKDALSQRELAALLRHSYDMVFAKLSNKTQEQLSRSGAAPNSSSKKASAPRTVHKRQGTGRRKAKTKSKRT